MNKSKIEWCDYTWNPVTGCLHECEYCYARVIANRFESSSSKIAEKMKHSKIVNSGLNCYEGEYNTPFPFGFKPTFYHERLDEPQKLQKQSSIFVCSMADLFGEWVPDEWIDRILNVCREATQHRYLFLTKNPQRYNFTYFRKDTTENIWFGASVTNQEQLEESLDNLMQLVVEAESVTNIFLSVEPLHEELEFNPYFSLINWVIIGAETGNRKGKIIPERQWIENIVTECRERGVPVFMKNSLKNIWEDELIQEYPWGVSQ